jgi:hypothetical protein
MLPLNFRLPSGATVTVTIEEGHENIVCDNVTVYERWRSADGWFLLPTAFLQQLDVMRLLAGKCSKAHRCHLAALIRDLADKIEESA